jgi:hypothetical protein
MSSIGRQALALLLSGVLAGLPVLAASPGNLVGMAQGSGAIQINGQPFSGHASLFSGDSIVTGPAAPLTVVTSSSERFRFEPSSSAQVTKEQRQTLIRLASGAVEFQSEGATSTELPGGLAVRPTNGQVTLAMVNRLANGDANVAVYKGTVEIVAPGEKASVSAGHTALVRANAQNGNQNNNNHKKKVWAIFISTGLTAAATGAILANEQSNPVSAIDP